MIRIALSKKIFLLFFSLTAMTFLVALTVFFGLGVLEKSQIKIQLLNDFRTQIKVLETFHPRHVHMGSIHNIDTFETELEKTRELAEAVNSFRNGLGKDLARQLRTLITSLGYYRDAYQELQEKYEYDQEIPAADPAISLGYLSKHARLTNAVHEKVDEILMKLLLLRMQTYHTRDVIHVQEMKQLEEQLSRLTDDPDVTHSVGRIIQRTENNYINYLAIRNREAFLRDTARRFTRISSETIAAISETYQANQVRMSWTIHALLVLSVLLTVTFWFFVTRYFKRFLC